MENRREILQKEARRYLHSIGLLPKTPINTESQIDPTDRISRLPDQILVHIVSFLPATPDLVYLSTVSKTWYRVWTLLPPIWDFSEQSFSSRKYPKTKYSEPRRRAFFTSVQTTLSKQCLHNKKFDVFRLHMSTSPLFVTSLVDHWIRLALHFFGAKNLDIRFFGTSSYCLPQTAFSAKELNVLRFGGGTIHLPEGDDWSSISWPSLRELHLPGARIDDQFVDSLISICPLLEKFYVQPRVGLERIHLSGFTKLREVKVVDELGFVKRIMIDAPTLTLFHYSCMSYRLGTLDLKACKNLEELRLEPFCFSTLNISYVLPLKITSLQNVSLGMSLGPIDLLKLGGFLGNFVSIQRLTLNINPLYVPSNLGSLRNSIINQPLLPNVKQLHLNIVTPSSSKRNVLATREDHGHLLDGLLCICHPKSMLLTSECAPHNGFIEVLYETLQHIPRTKCCESSLIKCWKHDLKGVVIKLIEANRGSWVLTTSVPSLEPNQKMSFSFMW